MKTVIYSQLVSNKSNATINTLTAVTKKDINSEIQARHLNFCADNKASRRELSRVYKDWYQVYRMRKPGQRMVLQSQVDTISKLETYLAPLYYGGAYCTTTTSENRSAEALAVKVSEKTGKSHYLVPIRWTVASLENAIKYCAKYYAGTEVCIEDKLASVK